MIIASFAIMKCLTLSMLTALMYLGCALADAPVVPRLKCHDLSRWLVAFPTLIPLGRQRTFD